MASLMIQGTASSAGKSLVAAAFCRIFANAGRTVFPFKSQNMSLNSYVTMEGLEMGRAQVLQAQAARVAPSVLMNPILLKPTTNRTSQVIIKGKPYQNMDAAAYFAFKPQLRGMLAEIYREIAAQADLIVIEGAGSPAEINLMDNDIVNMGMAAIADAPVLLVADIDRGGVFAALYGTVMLLPETDRARIKGFIINKFRGDVALLTPGLKQIEALTGIPVLGVLPFLPNLHLDEEDSATTFRRQGDGAIDVCVVKLPRLSNFTDFDPFRGDPDVTVRYIESAGDIGRADILIFPGSKNTIEDLRWVKRAGFARVLPDFRGIVFGICGGYQMLGDAIIDADGWEVRAGERETGLGVFPVTTILQGAKVTRNVSGTAGGQPIAGYEIHAGKTVGNVAPFVTITSQEGQPANYTDGDVRDERLYGTYIHGIFDSGAFRGGLLNRLRRQKALPEQAASDWQCTRETELDRLARAVQEHVDLRAVEELLTA